MSTEKGDHYKEKLITADMVGQPLDPALFEKVHPMPMMLSQAFKKIVFAGNRGKKDRIQDLKDAIGAIEREIELISESGWIFGDRYVLKSDYNGVKVAVCCSCISLSLSEVSCSDGSTVSISDLAGLGWKVAINSNTGERIKL